MSTVPTVKTRRLLLRGQRPDDTEELMAAYANDSYARFITLERRGLSRIEAWRPIALMAGGWAASGFGMWMVEERATGQPVGRVGPWNPEGWPVFEIGWSIFPAHHGKGYATEAAAAAMVWVHDLLDRDEVGHLIDPANPASEAVARNLGGEITGQFEFPNGVVASIWTTRWSAFLSSEAHRRYIAGRGATA